MSAIDEALAAAEKLVGTEVGVSNWITVDQEMIDRFAETTHDDQWIHVDTERAAAETPFGGTKQSGYGRERGVEALRGYTQLKTVNANIRNVVSPAS